MSVSSSLSLGLHFHSCEITGVRPQNFEDFFSSLLHSSTFPDSALCRAWEGRGERCIRPAITPRLLTYKW